MAAIINYIDLTITCKGMVGLTSGKDIDIILTRNMILKGLNPDNIKKFIDDLSLSCEGCVSTDPYIMNVSFPDNMDISFMLPMLLSPLDNILEIKADIHRLQQTRILDLENLNMELSSLYSPPTEHLHTVGRSI